MTAAKHKFIRAHVIISILPYMLYHYYAIYIRVYYDLYSAMGLLKKHVTCHTYMFKEVM